MGRCGGGGVLLEDFSSVASGGASSPECVGDDSCHAELAPGKSGFAESKRPARA